MPLNPPQVGRLSVCSTTVVMQHQLPGAEVTLLKDSRAFPLGLAKSVWEVMRLPSGMNLTRDDRIFATQSLNGETSPVGIPSIVEGTGPITSLPHPHPDSHIYVCAGNVALGGMTPGTNAEILIGGSVVGKALAHEGAAIVELSTGVPSASSVQARGTTCGQQPVTVTLPRADPTPLDQFERLPAPSFGSPLMECVTWLRIDAVVPGATVFLTRGDGSEQRWAFATRSWLVPLARPLQNGEPLTLRQEFVLCRISGERARGRVERLAVGVPKLTSPWCTGRVTVTNLTPGATVIFFASNGAERRVRNDMPVHPDPAAFVYIFRPTGAVRGPERPIQQRLRGERSRPRRPHAAETRDRRTGSRLPDAAAGQGTSQRRRLRDLVALPRDDRLATRDGLRDDG
jgi:hypothetical protein